jgi:hypothetical protein
LSDRDALTRARRRAQTCITRGIVLLVLIVPMILFGGVLAAIFHGSAEHVVVDVAVAGCELCTFVGLPLVVFGLVSYTRSQRRIHALDHATLPEARVVR